MSALTLSVSSDYGYVILAGLSTVILSTMHGFHTGKYRKAAKVPYPNCYASAEAVKESKDAYLFNCAQRAHANFTDHQPSTLAMLFIAGLEFPRSAAALGGIWTLGRYLYMVGYTNPDAGAAGRGRYRGSIYYVGDLGLLGLNLWMGVNMILAGFKN